MKGFRVLQEQKHEEGLMFVFCGEKRIVFSRFFRYTIKEYILQ